MATIEELYEKWHSELGRVYSSEEVGRTAGGPKFPKPFVCFNRDVTRDAIMHFVDGIGDINPLYRDEEHARKTKYGGLIAPPCYLFTANWGASTVGQLSGIHSWDSGDEWEFFRPLCVGDRIDWKMISPTDMKWKQSRHAGGKAFQAYSDHEYWRQGGETIARYRMYATFAAVPDVQRAHRDVESIKMQEYSQEELDRIYADQDDEVVRGANPRYWEDVEAGEELSPVVHGPLTVAEIVAWHIGCGELHMKCDRLWRMMRTNFPAGLFDPITKVVLNVETSHFDREFAQRVGGGAVYDQGSQRVSWLGMLLTNWIGDDGFVWKMKQIIRRFNRVGDTTWCKGKVVRKYVDDKKYCVDIDCCAENQRHEVIMPASATVILPSREHGPVVYPEPRHIPWDR